MEFGYQLVRQVYENVWNAEMFKWSMYSIQIVAVTFFLLTMYGNMVTTKFDWGEQKYPFDKSKLVNALFMVMLVLFYDKLIDLLDDILGAFDTWANNYSHMKHYFAKKMELEQATQAQDSTLFDKAKQLAIEAYTKITNPMSILNDLIFNVAWILDNVIYGIFLLERFFAITLLKISAPVVFVLSIHEKWQDLWVKWLKLYVAYWFLVVPFILVIFVGNEIYATVRANVEGSVFTPTMVESNLINIALVISVYIKYRLFKKSNDLVYKIFTQ